jgi:hypothetical protein
MIIYNSAGEKVRELQPWVPVDGLDLTYEWDGNNERGQAVASGVYLWRFESGLYCERRLLAVIR